jgi:hypothetical protein
MEQTSADSTQSGNYFESDTPKHEKTCSGGRTQVARRRRKKQQQEIELVIKTGTGISVHVSNQDEQGRAFIFQNQRVEG